MKNLSEYIIEASNSWNPDIVMTNEQFQNWINQQKTNLVFEVLVDIDRQWLKDLLRGHGINITKVYYDESIKKWVNETDDDTFPVDEWTLADDDIVYIKLTIRR